MKGLYFYNHYCIKLVLLIVASSCLLSCHNRFITRYHIVKKGDTLYSIAKKYNVKIEYLAKINSIRSPHSIIKGQKLALISRNKFPRINKQSINQSTYQKSLNSNNTYNIPTNEHTLPRNHLKIDNHQINQNNVIITNNSNNNSTIKDNHPINTKVPTKNNELDIHKKIENHSSISSSDAKEWKSNNKTNYKQGSRNWIWPAKGTVVKKFMPSGPYRGNGIDIAGKKGDPIVSIADGRVVYSGNALKGYGNLIIIKHDQDFLSAYAHNDVNLVQEQQIINKGQKIATMGNTESDRVMLHFEIRYKGKPIDPQKQIPKGL